MITYLHPIVAEEKPCIGARAHLEAGGAAPNGRLPDQQGEGAALVAPVTRAEDIWWGGRADRSRQLDSFRST